MELTKTTRLLFPFILSFSLISCGGSGFSSEGTTTTTDTSSNPDTDGDTTNTASRAATLEISASSAQLQSDGSIPVTISAIVKDQGNIILSDIDVAVTVDGNASVTPTTGTSIRTAQVLPGLNHPENRKLTITVSTLDGSNLSETLEVDVSGTEVQIDGPDNISLNTVTNFIIKLTDSSGKGLSNQPVIIESTNTQIDPADSSDSFVTDINGELKVSIVAAQGGTDTISISALGASTTKTITLSGEAFVLISDNTEVNINTHETVTLTLTGNSGAPIVGSLVNLVATRGQLTKSSDTTDSNGHIAFGISSPTAGNTVITATTVNSGLTATLVREFVAITPASITTEAEPVLIAPLNSSTISAKVLDVNNNPVKNQKVIFNLNDTVNGNLSSSSAVTNSSGRATVVYTAGDSTSAFEGVQISSYVDGFASNVNDNIELTVGGNALRLILGTDNKVATNSTTTYAVNYGVIVTDSSGNPVNDQTVEFTVTPVSFYKGELDNSGETWSNHPYIECPAEDRNRNGILDTVNEDTNNNGVLDPGEDSNVNGILDINEDLNGNGQLEPSNTASISAGGEAKTDSNGLVEIKVIYPKDQAMWSKVELKAKVAVNGTESYQKAQFILPIPAAEYNDIAVQPSNAHDSYVINVLGSPYGIDAASSADCRNAR